GHPQSDRHTRGASGTGQAESTGTGRRDGQKCLLGETEGRAAMSVYIAGSLARPASNTLRHFRSPVACGWRTASPRPGAARPAPAAWTLLLRPRTFWSDRATRWGSGRQRAAADRP